MSGADHRPLWSMRQVAKRAGGFFVALITLVLQTGCFPASWGAAAMLHPWRNPLKTARPAGAEDITFSSDGVQLKGWLFRGSGARRGTIIYLHGIADNRASGVSIAERYVPRGSMSSRMTAARTASRVGRRARTVITSART